MILELMERAANSTATQNRATIIPCYDGSRPAFVAEGIWTAETRIAK